MPASHEAAACCFQESEVNALDPPRPKMEIADRVGGSFRWGKDAIGTLKEQWFLEVV